MRLDAFLSRHGGLTRSEARAAVRAGRTRLQDRLVTDPACQVADGSLVELDGRLLGNRGHAYWMLYKPVGYECSAAPSHHPSAISLLGGAAAKTLHFAGRLDQDSTGLVLLTDDGRWSHGVASPRRSCAKRYLVRLAAPLDDEQITRLEQGVLLRGEHKPTAPARVRLCGVDSLRIEILEGRYHQIKRMFAAVGNRVVGLHREAIGPIELDPQLRPGQYRALTAAEIEWVWS